MFYEELDIKLEYFSGRQNVYSDFFNKVLSHSNFYRRFGGVFTGQKFIHCAEGLQDFIHEHDGKNFNFICNGVIILMNYFIYDILIQ